MQAFGHIQRGRGERGHKGVWDGCGVPGVGLCLGDRSHDGSIAACCSRDTAGGGGCSSHAAPEACPPSAATDINEATKETPLSPGHPPQTAGNKPPPLALALVRKMPPVVPSPGTSGGQGRPGVVPMEQGQAWQPGSASHRRRHRAPGAFKTMSGVGEHPHPPFSCTPSQGHTQTPTGNRSERHTPCHDPHPAYLPIVTL